MGLLHHPFWLQLVLDFFVHHLLKQLCLAKGTWWTDEGLVIWNAHIANIVYVIRFKMVKYLSRSIFLYFNMLSVYIPCPVFIHVCMFSIYASIAKVQLVKQETLTSLGYCKRVNFREGAILVFFATLLSSWKLPPHDNKNLYDFREKKKMSDSVPWQNWLVGCIEDLRRLSGISSMSRLEAGDNQSLKFKWRGGESNPGPLAPQANS